MAALTPSGRGFRLATRLVLLCCLCSAPLHSADERPPPGFALAQVYHLGEPIDLQAYRVSEKYDGVRAGWNGHQLITRSGRPIAAPPWFTRGWPAQALDGELWAGRGGFETASATVRRQTPDDDDWRRMRYLVFDLPDQPGPFDARLTALQMLAPRLKPWIDVVPQQTLTTQAALEARLAEVIASGGEGLMLRRGDAVHRAGRSRDLLKLKSHDDAEARVIAYRPGQGKYQGLVGALIVQRDDGLRFAVGSGLSDEQRRHPPAIGSEISYAYNGYTESGVPRFARFLRVRQPP